MGRNIKTINHWGLFTDSDELIKWVNDQRAENCDTTVKCVIARIEHSFFGPYYWCIGPKIKMWPQPDLHIAAKQHGGTADVNGRGESGVNARVQLISCNWPITVSLSLITLISSPFLSSSRRSPRCARSLAPFTFMRWCCLVCGVDQRAN